MSDNNSVSCECPEGYDEMYHCEKCNDCCFSWGTFKDEYAEYEDRGKCLSCAMDEGMTLEEAQYLIDQ